MYLKEKEDALYMPRGGLFNEREKGLRNKNKSVKILRKKEKE